MKRVLKDAVVHFTGVLVVKEAIVECFHMQVFKW